MSLFCIVLALVAFALFGLATDRHHRDRIGGNLPPTRKRALRIIAWLLVALSAVPAFMAQGAIFGGIFWLGALSIGASAIFLLLNLVPIHVGMASRNR